MPGSTQPYIVLFMPDELRADAVGCMCARLVQTPHLDRMAAEGVAFRNYMVNDPVSSPSRCPIFTGWYPHVCGHHTLSHLLRPHEPNLFRYLKEAGCHVTWWSKNGLLAYESLPLSVSHRGKVRAPFRGDIPWPEGHPYIERTTMESDPVSSAALATASGSTVR